MSATATSIEQRVADLNAENLVFKAIRKCSPGNKRGNTSKCWQLDPNTLHTAAMMHIVGFKSAATIHKELNERFVEAGISTRVLSTWLASILKAHGAEHTKYLAEVEANESVAFMSGDLVALLAITMAAIAPKFIGWAKALDIGEIDNKDQHVMLRFLNTQIDAAKVQSEAKRTEAQTRILESKALESVKKLGDPDATPQAREEQIKNVTELIHTAMGMRGTA